MEAEKPKSWREVKEKRKKRKEQQVIKKFKKAKLQEEEETVSQQVKQQQQTKVESISTLSIAVPGSILDNAQSRELRTYLAGQIARAACIFKVDEIVVFDDYGDTIDAKKSKIVDGEGVKTGRRCCVQLARILQFLECPQYLRKFFFPLHEDLNLAGLLNPLDAPHHLRQNDEFPFREGIVTNKPVREGRGSFVNVGLLRDVQVDKILEPNLRVTVKLHAKKDENSKKINGEIVSPDLPRIENGTYWGYTVRLANSLTQVFSQAPYKGGYDLTVGTSDKGTLVDEAESSQYEHALIVFGGLQGLEAALENDEMLTADDPSQLFDHYLNTLPEQGSRTIRTEEAILVTLSAIRNKIVPKHNRKPTNVTDDMSRFD